MVPNSDKIFQNFVLILIVIIKKTVDNAVCQSLRPSITDTFLPLSFIIQILFLHTVPVQLIYKMD